MTMRLRYRVLSGDFAADYKKGSFPIEDTLMTEEQKPKWTVERIRNEVYDARTKLFVITKVLETGNIKLHEQPEWVLVLTPLLTELQEYTAAIQEFAKGPEEEGEPKKAEEEKEAE